MPSLYPVPGYPHLATSRPQGTNLDAGQINVGNVSPTLLSKLDRVGVRLNRVVTIFSGYRTSDYSAKVGGFRGDPHSKGIAVDASIGGTLIGDYPGAVDAIHSLGLRTGATDFKYKGKADPSHVDLLTATDAPTSTQPTTQPAVDSGTAPELSASDQIQQYFATQPPPPGSIQANVLQPNDMTTPTYPLTPQQQSASQSWKLLSALPGASPDTMRFAQMASYADAGTQPNP